MQVSEFGFESYFAMETLYLGMESFLKGYTRSSDVQEWSPINRAFSNVDRNQRRRFECRLKRK